MPKTSPIVKFGLYDMAIRADSNLSCSDLQTFSKLTDLQANNVGNYPYATYEPDYWLLDGTFKFMPATANQIHVGLMSLSQSDENGLFVTPPELEITFSQEWDTDNLTLIFSRGSEDWASQVEISYYDDADNLIQNGIFAPTDNEFSTGQACSGFAKLIIKFLQTNQPYRYARLQALNYGELITFTSADIKSCIVVEEINPISTELPIGTLNLTLRTNRFSIVNPTGDFANLQNWQPMDVYETVDGTDVYIGQYFLEEWRNKGETEIEFRAVDVMGILDSKTDPYGRFANAGPGVYLDYILDGYNLIYEIDTELLALTRDAYLPIGTARNALQLTAFAFGAFINVTRSGIVRLQKLTLPADTTTYDFSITRAQKGLKQELSLKPLVTGVEILGYDYFSEGAWETVFTGTLTAGTYYYYFDHPQSDFRVTGATLDWATSTNNFMSIIVSTPGSVLFESRPSLEKQTLFSVNATLAEYVKQNKVKINNATSINEDSGQEAAQRVYDYYQHRYLQKVRLYAPECAPGDLVTIETWQGKTIAGIVEKMSTNLSGGFVVDAEITGVILP